MPTLFFAIFFSVAGWMFYRPAESMYAELQYERLERFRFPAVPMDTASFGMTRANFKRMLKSLDDDPVSLRSSTSRIDVVAKQEKVWLELSEGPHGVVYRVDPNSRSALLRWTIKNSERLNETRDKELERLSPKFGAALAKQSTGEGSAQEIAAFRDTVMLARMTGGFGFNVVAVSGKSAYRCIYEDSKGRLYFLLPASTRSFVLRGRPIGNADPILPGEIIVAAPRKKPELPASTTRRRSFAVRMRTNPTLNNPTLKNPKRKPRVRTRPPNPCAKGSLRANPNLPRPTRNNPCKMGLAAFHSQRPQRVGLHAAGPGGHTGVRFANSSGQVLQRRSFGRIMPCQDQPDPGGAGFQRCMEPRFAGEEHITPAPNRFPQKLSSRAAHDPHLANRPLRRIDPSRGP